MTETVARVDKPAACTNLTFEEVYKAALAGLCNLSKRSGDPELRKAARALSLWGLCMFDGLLSLDRIFAQDDISREYLRPCCLDSLAYILVAEGEYHWQECRQSIGMLIVSADLMFQQLVENPRGGLQSDEKKCREEILRILDAEEMKDQAALTRLILDDEDPIDPSFISSMVVAMDDLLPPIMQARAMFSPQPLKRNSFQPKVSSFPGASVQAGMAIHA